MIYPENWDEEVRAQLDGATTRVEALRIALGLAVDVETDADRQALQDLTLEAFQRVDTVPQGAVGVLLQVRAERTRQIERGYTPEHDDQHGLTHLLDEAYARMNSSSSRANLVAVAALVVAAIEWIDRSDAHLAEYPDDAEPIQ